jgi:dTDP-4-dehydrorhamnose 3,5-epimerase
MDQGASGTFNVSNSGARVSWHEIAKRIYEIQGSDSALVKPISTAEYFAGNPKVSPRPKFSALSLEKMETLGIAMPDWEESLVQFLSES